MWVAVAEGKLVWAALPVVSPGRTLLLFAPAQPANSVIPAAEAVVSQLCARFAGEDVDLAQVLLDPEDVASRRFFGEQGFVEIAELIYLQGYVQRNAEAPVLASSMRWVSYSAESHRLFADAIQRSYRESLDCPALSGLRDIEDIIAGHKSTGEYDSALWLLLLEADQPVGVLLLSRIPHSDAVELVYLGLAPESRGRGMGKLLMQEASHRLALEQKRRLTLAVDSKNTPALKLYSRHGMQRIAARMAMIRDLRRPR
jgi:ribosomal protein S18 acetylase RimI-like enzyme